MYELRTMSDIRAAAMGAESHWFDKETLRFFGSRVSDKVYRGGQDSAYFVSSEADPSGDLAWSEVLQAYREVPRPRKYTVRNAGYNNLCEFYIETVGEFMAYNTHYTAHTVAKRIAEKERAAYLDALAAVDDKETMKNEGFTLEERREAFARHNKRQSAS